MPDSTDARYMKQAIRLARRGRGLTSPNPMVGALVVKGGLVLGEGYHHAAGKPHAEVLALTQAGKRAKGATLYTNLEPCCHTEKRTPPCTDTIIQSGIRRVVAAIKDPNPQVSGKGFDRLLWAGIEVVEGLCAEDADALNVAYIKHAQTGHPWVTLKAAMTLDGRIATASGESQWISGKRARLEVDRLRAYADAVLVGIGTVEADNPMLTLRQLKGKNPLRIVIDPQLKISNKAHLATTLSTAPTLIFTTVKAPSKKIKQLQEQGLKVVVLSMQKGLIPFEAILDDLGKRGIMNLLIEGGGAVNGIALRAKGVDRVIFYIAPKMLCGDDAVSVVSGKAIKLLADALVLDEIKLRPLGEDIRVEGRIRK